MLALPFMFVACGQSDSGDKAKGSSSELTQDAQKTTKAHRMDVIPLVARYHQNPVAFHQALKDKYPGLKDPEQVRALARSGNYVEALKFVWSEPDYAKQVQFMVDMANEGHPIFMMEVSLAALRVKPELNTLKSFFAWQKAGMARTIQDLSCVSDASAREATAKLDVIYQTSVNRILKKDPQEIEKYFFANQKDIDRAIYMQVSKVLANSLKNMDKMPAPTWIAYHGNNARTSSEPSMLAQDSWDTARKQYALEQINRIRALQQKQQELEAKASAPASPEESKK